MRLQRLQAQYGARVQIERRAFPLRPAPEAAAALHGRQRAATWRRIADMVAAEGIAWQPWQREDYPHWSLPALEAAKCAALQTSMAAEDMHTRLFQGFFAAGINIAKADEILALALQAPLDYARFAADLASGMMRRAILDEYAEAVNAYMIRAIPTVIVNDHERVVGAVSLQEYVKVLEKCGLESPVGRHE